MKIKSIVLVMVLFSATHFAIGQELLILEEAIAIAMQNNHEINVARNDETISKNNVHIGNADLLPRVDIVSTMNYQDQAGDIDQSSTLTNAQIQATYTLFDGFGNIYSFKKLKAAGEVGDLQARNSIELTILQVSSAYYDIANAYESFNITRDAVTLSNERLTRAQRRAEFGQANTIDVLSAQVDLNADSVAFLNARLNLDESKRNLNVLLNEEVSRDFSVESDVSFRDAANLLEFQQSAVSNNAEYLTVINSLEQSKLDLKIVRSFDYPQLGLQLGYGFDQTASGLDVALNDANRGFTAIATLSFNLFNGFQTSIQKQNARIAISSQELLQQKARLSLERSVADAFESYQNSLNILELQERNLQSAELNFQRTQELYNLGQVTMTTFREAQLNLIQAKNDISSAKFDAKVLELELLKLSGELLTDR